MSPYSTLRVTRSKAIAVFLEKLLGDISDEELEELMDDILQDRLLNVIIVGDDDEYNDDELI